jgi:hypothetical protein
MLGMFYYLGQERYHQHYLTLVHGSTVRTTSLSAFFIECCSASGGWIFVHLCLLESCVIHNYEDIFGFFQCEFNFDTDHLKPKTSHFHKRISNEFYLTPDSNNQNSKNRHKIKMVLLGFV